MNDHSSSHKPLQILAISGSLRAVSSNTSLLRAAIMLAPADVNITLYDGLADLPHFNPDLDTDEPPPTVVEFRRQLQEADGVLISSPEYAHGVPGVLKNALDWIVGSGEFMGKPVALLNASLVATIAQASLQETLSVMMAHIVGGASIPIPLGSNRVDATGMAGNAEVAAALRGALALLVEMIEEQRVEAEGG